MHKLEMHKEMKKRFEPMQMPRLKFGRYGLASFDKGIHLGWLLKSPIWLHRNVFKGILGDLLGWIAKLAK